MVRPSVSKGGAADGECVKELKEVMKQMLKSFSNEINKGSGIE